jgi:NitT/TauT family transport system substrate-binding protein
MEALLKGEVEIAGMNEVPFIIRVFEEQRISIYASLDKLQYIYLIGRKDRGIQTAADLKGKRIGLPRGTIAEFYLGRYLELNGLSVKDVALVNTAPPSAGEAIDSNLDGVVVWNPFAYQIKQQMANRTAILRVQSNQPAYAVAVARNDWLAAQKEPIKRSLKAIAQAEQYVVNHPSEARAIVQKRLNYDVAFMESVWAENQFSLSLDQSLITAMEDEARWMIKNNLTTGKKVPDFVKYIYPDCLKAVKPDAVNIIR